MAFHQSNDLRFYSFDLFDNTKVIQGLFTRHGGVSPTPWASLNTGGTVGDERVNIIENRRRIFSSFGRPVESLFDVWQVHGVEACCATAPRPLDQPHQKADIIMTDRSEITLFMRFADCVPIFLHDTERSIVAIVHAGWKGTVDKAAHVAVQRMHLQYGSQPNKIWAGIGPSVGPDHYEVGPDVISRVKDAFGGQADNLLEKKGQRVCLNLWEANRYVLQQSGVETIQIAGICTACNVNDWFSHRGENGKTGRYGAIFALKG